MPKNPNASGLERQLNSISSFANDKYSSDLCMQRVAQQFLAFNNQIKSTAKSKVIIQLLTIASLIVMALNNSGSKYTNYKNSISELIASENDKKARPRKSTKLDRAIKKFLLSTLAYSADPLNYCFELMSFDEAVISGEQHRKDFIQRADHEITRVNGVSMVMINQQLRELNKEAIKFGSDQNDVKKIEEAYIQTYFNGLPSSKSLMQLFMQHLNQGALSTVLPNWHIFTLPEPENKYFTCQPPTELSGQALTDKMTPLEHSIFILPNGFYFEQSCLLYVRENVEGVFEYYNWPYSNELLPSIKGKSAITLHFGVEVTLANKQDGYGQANGLVPFQFNCTFLDFVAESIDYSYFQDNIDLMKDKLIHQAKRLPFFRDQGLVFYCNKDSNKNKLLCQVAEKVLACDQARAQTDYQYDELLSRIRQCVKLAICSEQKEVAKPYDLCAELTKLQASVAATSQRHAGFFWRNRMHKGNASTVELLNTLVDIVNSVGRAEDCSRVASAQR